MPRPSQIEEQTRKLIPIVCQVFSELGYRRATTAELAGRCRVRENILYRLWPNKKAMFLAAIDEIFQARSVVWSQLLEDSQTPEQAMQRIVRYETIHQGDSGFYRIVFAALTETDDPEIQSALTGMYRRFHKLVCHHVDAGRNPGHSEAILSAESAAWGLLGLATMSNIIRELKLLPKRQREKMFEDVAECLMNSNDS
ncbi:MAG: TetR/AcrR family transcriptional regulator [Fuerstiella sp.]|nr:TetR/AcrR family transcriptional regulator [Fuerstiella sp.]